MKKVSGGKANVIAGFWPLPDLNVYGKEKGLLSNSLSSVYLTGKFSGLGQPWLEVGLCVLILPFGVSNHFDSVGRGSL